jgi:uncharacterized protein
MNASAIIDVHTHGYSSEVIKNPKTWADDRGEHHWRKLHVPENKKSIQDWCNIESMIEKMDDAGIQTAILLGWYWEKHSTCIEQNQWYKEWIKKYPARLKAFTPIQPLAGEQSIEFLKRSIDDGFFGIGEMLPTVQGFRMQDPKWLKIVELCIENNLAINMHVTEAVGRNHLGNVPTPFSEFQWLAETYPEAKLILAHWGGLLPFYELNPDIKKKFKNVYYDTAASPLLYDPKIHTAIVNAIGHEKILFGTDFPLMLYPKKQKEADFSTYLEEIKKSGLSHDALESILFKNAQRLLRI